WLSAAVSLGALAGTVAYAQAITPEEIPRLRAAAIAGGVVIAACLGSALKLSRTASERTRKLAAVVAALDSEIAEHRATAADLAHARDQAIAATKAKSDFLATMSHEVRTPLNGILGMADLILDTPLDSTQRHQLSLLKESATALLDVINEILDFSKIEA